MEILIILFLLYLMMPNGTKGNPRYKTIRTKGGIKVKDTETNTYLIT